MSVVKTIWNHRDGSQLHRHSQTSGANAIQTINIPIGGIKQIVFATLVFSASVTKNLVITLDSGLGSTHDLILETIAVSGATNGIWQPTTEILLAPDDILKCVVDAAGVGETSALAVYFRTL